MSDIFDLYSRLLKWFSDQPIEYRAAIIAAIVSVITTLLVRLVESGFVSLWRTWQRWRMSKRPSILLTTRSINYYLYEDETLPDYYEFLFIDLGIQNIDPMDKLIEYYDAEAVYPKDWKLFPIDEKKDPDTSRILGEAVWRDTTFFSDENAGFWLNFYVDALFQTPFKLKPKELYTEKLCFRFIDLPASVKRTKVNILMKDNYDKEYKISVVFHKQDNRVSIIREPKGLKKILWHFQELWASC